MPAVTKIQVRRGTAAQWATANPVLDVGEQGFETDTKRFKYGDGSTVWNNLPYWGYQFLTTADKGVANGVASLDSSGKLPVGQLPANASALPAWQPSTAYIAGQQVIASTGTIVSAYEAHTSGATYDPRLWYADCGYLITTFTANLEANEKLSVFYSPDGKTVYGDGAIQVYTDPNNGKSLRDPSTIRIGETWFTAYTINNGIDKTFGVIRSNDLLNWTQVAVVNVSSVPSMNRAWAPELIVDTNGDIYAFFTRVDVNFVGRTYYVKATSSDLSTWSAPVAMAWSTAPTDYIDPTFVRRNGTWYCFYKHEGTKYLERATSSTLTGTYTTDKSGDWAGWGSGIEGPELVRLDKDRWRLYFDRYQADLGYAWTESNDLTTWTTPVSLVKAPNLLGNGQTIRHGSYVKLTDAGAAAQVMAAVNGRAPRHAELIASVPNPANSLTGPGLLAFDNTDGYTTSNASGFVSIPKANVVKIEVSGYYSINWVGSHAGIAAGTGAFMALKSEDQTNTYATVDVPSTSGESSVGHPAKYYPAGTIIQFFCKWQNALTLTSRITIHKE